MKICLHLIYKLYFAMAAANTKHTKKQEKKKKHNKWKCLLAFTTVLLYS